MEAGYPDGPKSFLGLGTARDFRTYDLLELSQRMTRAHGGFVHVRVLHKHLFFVSDPELIATILEDRSGRYDKLDTRTTINHIAGDSLNTLRRDQGWSEKQARFERHVVVDARTAAIVTRAVDRLLDAWEEKTASHMTVDASADLLRLSTSIASATFFDQDVDDLDIETLNRHKYRIVRTMLARQLQVVRPPRFWDRGLVRAIHYRDALVRRVIERHLERPERPESYIGDLVAAYDIRAADRRAVRLARGEILSALYLASDPFDKLLAKSLYYLALNPDESARIRADIDELGGDDGLTPSSAPTLRHVRHFLMEVLRLRTPYAIVGREALVDHELAGYRVPRKSIFAITPLIVHTDDSRWERPADFDPSRFERISLPSAHHYLPFSAGERGCPGQGFAMRHAMYIVARIARSYDIELVDGVDYSDEFVGVLSSREPYRFTIRAR